MPAPCGPPFDCFTVASDGKYTLNRSFHSSPAFFWINTLGSLRLLAGNVFAVRRTNSVRPSSPILYKNVVRMFWFARVSTGRQREVTLSREVYRPQELVG